MKNNGLIVVLLVIIIGGAAVLTVKNKKADDKMMAEDQVMMEDEAMVGEDKMMDDKTMEGEVMVDEEEEMMEDDDKMMMADKGDYVAYDEKSFKAAKDSKRVLFFHAGWCPTCRPVDKELTEKIKEIPEGVVVFKVNYDTAKALKKKHEVTYQHTFVLVDEDGVEVSKWNGGGLAEIIDMTQ